MDLFISMYEYRSACMHAWIYLSMYGSRYACMHAIYPCMHVHIHAWMYLSIIFNTPSFIPPLMARSARVAWVDLIRALQGMESTGVKVVEIDNDNYYVRAEAPSKVPPNGIDDLEFVFLPNDGLVLYRSASRDSVYVYPVQQPLSDQETNRERLKQIRLSLGWDIIGSQYGYQD